MTWQAVVLCAQGTIAAMSSGEAQDMTHFYQFLVNWLQNGSEQSVGLGQHTDFWCHTLFILCKTGQMGQLWPLSTGPTYIVWAVNKKQSSLLFCAYYNPLLMCSQTLGLSSVSKRKKKQVGFRQCECFQPTPAAAMQISFLIICVE